MIIWTVRGDVPSAWLRVADYYVKGWEGGGGMVAVHGCSVVLRRWGTVREERAHEIVVD
tara:strand:- start:578 stop:754 length:177 start_codon:yes stop_codon:yes gene_type:complete